ncbi:MAG TPA: ferrous iron transport protein B [Candidatus Methanofastidiosa archaeon]|nr:ferrous iron transport protein B [Candidatus Methanofastidiosa archaeon]HPR41424.1 ferrous iron transport protein B [Candidatus Methanofastidiosa archaeon]
MENDNITIALAGNPNVGKTTLFNSLTGTRQHVGNWPGVTVEKKVGTARHKGRDITIVDLPGTYSLSAYSLDELVTRDYIIKGRPDAVIHILDASNLERNLYLTIQLLELDVNVVLALNMYDIVKNRGDTIDVEMLSKNLGVPVVETVASTGEGIEELIDAALRLPKEGIERYRPFYGEDLEERISKVMDVLGGDDKVTPRFPRRWLAIKVLEEDKEVLKLLEGSEVEPKLKRYMDGVGQNTELELVNRRYENVRCVMSGSCKLSDGGMDPSDMLDKVVTNKYLGIPIFLAMMWAAFEMTFKVAEPFTIMIDKFFSWLMVLITENVGNGTIASLLGDGIIGGVGSVLVFVPNIFLLFLIISLLEDSGYLARAAFVMDKVMSRIGLHGKSFIPLLIGFGCSVPAIMACRSIEDNKDRIITILSTPFITCGARFPVYVLFAGAFFADSEGTVVFSMYLLSILMAIVSVILLRRFIFKGEKSPFILEIPPYRMPTMRSALLHMWDRGKMYLKKAGTIIFLGAIIIWVLASFPPGVEYGSGDSFVGMIGKVLEPLISPLGFDWKIAVALTLGFVAKEIVVGSLGTLYGTGENDDLLRDQLRNDPSMTPLTSLGVMIFTLIYVPCLATVAIIRKETNSWKWTLFSILYSMSLAWVITFVVYRVGLLLGY